MSHSPIAVALTATAGFIAGAVAVRPALFAFTVPEGARSTCPHCGRRILGAGLRPYLDLVLHRRCPACAHRPVTSAQPPEAAPSAVDRAARIGPAALLPEVLTALGTAGVVLGGASGWLLAAQLWLTVLGAALLLIEATVKRLPDLLTGAAAVGAAVLLGASAALDAQWAAFGRAAAAAGVVGVVFLLGALSGMLGLGDVKLAPVLAGLLGWHSWAALYLGIAAGLLLGAAQGLVLMLAGSGRKTEIAFGPALLIGAIAVSAAVG